MKDFTTIAVWNAFPFPWPPGELVRIHRLLYDDGAIEIWAHTDGHIEMVVIPPGTAEPTRGHFQRLQTPARPTAAVMQLTMAEGVLGMTLNATRLRSLSDVGEVPYVLPFTEPPPAEHSIDHRDARAACAVWISQRQSRFSEKQPFKAKGGRERIKKMTSRQIDELRNSGIASARCAITSSS